MPLMRRQIFIHLLFAWLLLPASALNHVTPGVQAMQSGIAFAPSSAYSSETIFFFYFKFRTPQAIPESQTRHAIPSWVNEKNRKSPSGPNPVGNQRPPSKP
ncbi:hypothetical protein VNO80_24640 [Phaseolus coccineus]|uniref:Secreted protein n=1 Tax=Phaseolus coccineus TaxID=3886 RepID=A0AAN9QSJ6_PHACN